MNSKIVIKSFNGIGDLLFVTPTIRKLKEAYPNVVVRVNTNFPGLLKDNPYIDSVGTMNEGVFLGYPDPIHQKWPTKHHIYSDWDIVENELDAKIPRPDLKPEIYLELPNVKSLKVGIQMMHKGHWYKKKVWPFFDELLEFNTYEAIPKVRNVVELVELIATYSAVVCAEGGISHIAKAVGTPAVVIYGGFADPEWNGYDDQYNLTNKYWCSYCYNPKPCLEETERKCMREIRVQDVLNAVKEILRTQNQNQLETDQG